MSEDFLSDFRGCCVRLSGFTFVRNGESLGYPYLESIRSALPVCDEFVIAVGQGDDATLERLQSLSAVEPKVKLIETTWNENMSDRGFVYAQQKMIAQYACTGDWVFYIEGDEVLHEQDTKTLRHRLEAVHDDERVEALLFDYHHLLVKNV
ncbi:MAG: glycosyltransferase family 2 protein [bacterium]